MGYRLLPSLLQSCSGWLKPTSLSTGRYVRIWHVDLAWVRCGSGVGLAHASQGVQGYPLSTDLFGIMIEILDEYLKISCPNMNE